MTFADFSASLAALFTKTGGKFDDVQVEDQAAQAAQAAQATQAPTAPTAAETELQKFRDEAAARLTARRTVTTAIATTAFGTKNPSAFSAMQTAIAAATDEGTLAALEAACAVATPSALTQSHRVSSGQRIDEDSSGEGDDQSNTSARNVKGIDTSAIYKARAQAMRGGRN